MSKFMVNVSAESSKADEVNAIGKIAANMPSGSYLSSLFTQDLVDWVSEQIRWDFTPDLLGNMQHAIEQSDEKLALANAAIRDSEIMQRRLERKVEELEAALDEANGKADRLAVALSDERSAFDRSAVAADQALQRERNRVARYRTAMSRMRSIFANREEKWTFLLKKIRS